MSNEKDISLSSQSFDFETFSQNSTSVYEISDEENAIGQVALAMFDEDHILVGLQNTEGGSNLFTLRFEGKGNFNELKIARGIRNLIDLYLIIKAAPGNITCMTEGDVHLVDNPTELLEYLNHQNLSEDFKNRFFDEATQSAIFLALETRFHQTLTNYDISRMV
jgi:hypothetical protein